MKKKEFEAIGKQLMLYLPEFGLNGDLLFIQPIEHVVRGICFNGSIDPRSFYVEVFLQPLFVPSEHIRFNIGWRLRGKAGGPTGWNANSPGLVTELRNELQREALPFLRRIQSPKDLADAASTIHPIQGPGEQKSSEHNSRDPITQQAIAFALARAGDAREACDALDRLVRLVNGNNFWQHEVNRALALKSQLLRDPAAAQRQLDDWEAETVRNLGLEEFWNGGGTMAR